MLEQSEITDNGPKQDELNEGIVVSPNRVKITNERYFKWNRPDNMKNTADLVEEPSNAG